MYSFSFFVVGCVRGTDFERFGAGLDISEGNFFTFLQFSGFMPGSGLLTTVF